MNTIKLKFWRNAVIYKDLRINIGEGIRFCVYSDDMLTLKHFDIKTTLYDTFARVQVSQSKSNGDYVSETFTVVDEIEREFSL